EIVAEEQGPQAGIGGKSGEQSETGRALGDGHGGVQQSEQEPQGGVPAVARRFRELSGWAWANGITQKDKRGSKGRNTPVRWSGPPRTRNPRRLKNSPRPTPRKAIPITMNVQ